MHAIKIFYFKAHSFSEKTHKNLRWLTKTRKVIQQTSYNIAIYYYWCTIKNTYTYCIHVIKIVYLKAQILNMFLNTKLEMFITNTQYKDKL